MSKDKTVKAQMMFSNEKFPYLPLRELKADALGECTVWKIEIFTYRLGQANLQFSLVKVQECC